jgi:translation initiation factor 2 subunit 3
MNLTLSQASAGPADFDQKSTPNPDEQQPAINVGILGHVAHGKSSLIKALSGVSTGKFLAEIKNNMTIKLGYTNIKIYQCLSCPQPGCFKSWSSDKKITTCHLCGEQVQFMRHISIIDSPGHHDLMATMLTGASVMDAVILVIAADETCPSPQTAEHLMVASLLGLSDKMIVVQTKLDLVSRQRAEESYCEIIRFLNLALGYEARPSIVPVAAEQGFNLDVLSRYLCHQFPTPVRQNFLPAHMNVVRTFDVNKPGQLDNKTVGRLRGGVLGGTLTQGTLAPDQEVEIRPGLILSDGRCQPVAARVLSLRSQQQILSHAGAGGLVGVSLDVDPALCRSDRLVGQVLGACGSLPPVFLHVTVSYRRVKRDLGVKQAGNKAHREYSRLAKLKKNEDVLVSIGSARVQARVVKVASSTERDVVRLTLVSPLCAPLHAQVALFRNCGTTGSFRWVLMGFGELTQLTELDLLPLAGEDCISSDSSSGTIPAPKCLQHLGPLSLGDAQVLRDLTPDMFPASSIDSSQFKFETSSDSSASSDASDASDLDSPPQQGPNISRLGRLSKYQACKISKSRPLPLRANQLKKRLVRSPPPPTPAARIEAIGQSSILPAVTGSTTAVKDEAIEPVPPRSFFANACLAHAAETEETMKKQALQSSRVPEATVDANVIRVLEGKLSQSELSKTAQNLADNRATMSKSTKSGMFTEEATVPEKCYWRKRTFPRVGAIVAAIVSRSDPDQGLWCSLPEYGNLPCLIPGRELNRGFSQKKLPGARSIVPALVLHVDAGTQFVQLSRVRVSHTDSIACKARYRDLLLVKGILARVAKLSSCSLQDLYAQVVWPIRRKSVLQTFQDARRFPERAMPHLYSSGICVLPALLHKKLFSEICRRLPLKVTETRATVSLTCYAPSGVERLRAALLTVFAPLGPTPETFVGKTESRPSSESEVRTVSSPSTQSSVVADDGKEFLLSTPSPRREGVSFSVYLEASPRYVIATSGFDEQQCRVTLLSAILQLSRRIQQLGGQLAVLTPLKTSISN